MEYKTNFPYTTAMKENYVPVFCWMQLTLFI